MLDTHFDEEKLHIVLTCRYYCLWSVRNSECHILLPSKSVKWLLIGNWFQCDIDEGKAEGSGVWFIVNIFNLGMKISSRLCFSGTCCIWYAIWFEKEKEERCCVLIHSPVQASRFLLVSNFNQCESFTVESFIFIFFLGVGSIFFIYYFYDLYIGLSLWSCYKSTVISL